MEYNDQGLETKVELELEEKGFIKLYRYSGSGKAIPVVRRKDFTPLFKKDPKCLILPEPPSFRKTKFPTVTSSSSAHHMNYFPPHQTYSSLRIQKRNQRNSPRKTRFKTSSGLAHSKLLLLDKKTKKFHRNIQFEYLKLQQKVPPRMKFLVSFKQFPYRT